MLLNFVMFALAIPLSSYAAEIHDYNRAVHCNSDPMPAAGRNCPSYHLGFTWCHTQQSWVMDGT
ncbi:hypothetical protein C8Q72DRAFT_1000246, partial [Fomitopsis betulina]